MMQIMPRIFLSLILATALSLGFLLANSAWAESIDWESGLDFKTNATADRSDNGLPGVRAVPRAKPVINCRTNSQGSGGNSANQCENKKKPLIVIREGHVEGLLFEFPR